MGADFSRGIGGVLFPREKRINVVGIYCVRRKVIRPTNVKAYSFW